MPQLFPEIARTRTEALRRGERQFDYYNVCARHGYDEFRALVNGWLSEMSEADQAELIARMSLGGDRAFQAGLIELVVHALLKKTKHEIEVHPVVKGTTNRPDFGVVNKEGQTLGYVEVTTINPPSLEDAEENRESPIYNAIDRAKLPAGCVLGYELVRAGTSSPPLGELVGEVEAWASVLCEQAKEGPVTKTFSVADWEIELDLIAADPTKNYEHAIGISHGGAEWIAPHIDLREALNRKTRRYGTVDAPYLIVVADSKEQIAGAESVNDALTEAVFGDEVVQWSEGQPAEQGRAKNGFWFGSEGPRNTHVSAIMLFPDTGLWGLRSENHQPILAINPWADRPVPDFLKTFRRFEAESEKWILKDGQIVADVLALPSPWPPEKS